MLNAQHNDTNATQTMISSDIYSVSFHLDPCSKMQHVACFNNFDTEEIVDGYTHDHIEHMIEYLRRVQSELAFKNIRIHTPDLFNGV